MVNELLLVVITAIAITLLFMLGPFLLIRRIRAIDRYFSKTPHFRVPLWPSSAYKFDFAGRRFAMGATDNAAHAFLHQLGQLFENAPSKDNPRALFKWRDDFRRILGSCSTAGLVRSVKQGSETEQRIAVWLLGRARDHSATCVVNAVVWHQPVAMRREAARALRRLGAWTELRWLAVNDPDERVRRIATPRPSRDFSSRLAEFKTEVTVQILPERKPEFHLFTEINREVVVRPKSRDLIARLLHHIRLLIRGVNGETGHRAEP